MNPTRAANCLILLLQAYIVKLATRGDFIPIVIVGVVASVFFLPKAWQLQPKRLLIATVVIPWVCLIKYQIWPSESILHGVGEWLLLTSGALALWGPVTYRGWRLGPLLAFGCGCCFFVACEPSSMLASNLRPLVIAHVIAFSICQNLQAVPNSGHQNSYTRLILLSLLVMVAALGSWSLADAWADNAAQLQRWLNEQVTWASGRTSQLRGYVRIGQLDSIRKEQISDPERVAIKVYADSAPGYMRGRVFDTYDGGHWRSRRRRRNRWNRTWTNRNVQPMIVAPDGLPSPQRGESQFALKPSSGPWIQYEVWNDPDRGEMFFTPLRTSILFGTGTFVSLDEHEIIHSGITSREPYTVFVDRRATESVSPELRQQLLSPMYRADSQLIRTQSDRLCRTATTISEKIAAVRGYFRSEFEYSLDPVAVPSGKDRLDFFLESRPAAHCEYFATATVALLRAQDIPARFVTGYVVTELEDEYEDYWLARNRNAHAWAEAFDEDNQRWVIVESTPNMPLLEEAEERINQRQVAETEATKTCSVWCVAVA